MKSVYGEENIDDELILLFAKAVRINTALLEAGETSIKNILEELEEYDTRTASKKVFSRHSMALMMGTMYVLGMIDIIKYLEEKMAGREGDFKLHL